MPQRYLPVLAVCLLGLAAHAEPELPPVVGVWETEDGRSRVQIHACRDDEHLCGSLVWTKSGNRANLGKPILTGFVFRDGRWVEGRIHDPRDGSNYRARLELADEDKLRVKGCWFIFCGGQTWTRLPPHRVEAMEKFDLDIEG